MRNPLLLIALTSVSIVALPVHAKAQIPTATNVDHVGLVVPDLDQATKFFVDVLGAERTYTFASGPGTASPASLASRFGVDPQANLHGAMFRLGPSINIELLQYHTPRQRRVPPRNSDVDAPHLAFFVTDLDSAAGYLQAHGCRLRSGPVKAKDGPNQGQSNRYLETPWGLTLELIYRPSDQPYKAETSARLFGPSPGWSTR